MARIIQVLLVLCIIAASTFGGTSNWSGKGKRQTSSPNTQTNCSCGVFLTSQLVKGSTNSPVGTPAISVDVEEDVTCGPLGSNQCTTECLQELVKFMPTSSSIICGTVDRDVYKEKVHLFFNLCNKGWVKSKVSTSKEICCKNSADYKCPST